MHELHNILGEFKVRSFFPPDPALMQGEMCSRGSCETQLLRTGVQRQRVHRNGNL